MENRAVDYELLEKERSLEIQMKMQKQLAQKAKSAFRGDGVRNRILRMVTQSQYDQAIQDIERYVTSKRDYPSFGDRVKPYLKHCTDIIHAIQTKRTLPGISLLSTSKQQELYEKVDEHFEELKHYLRKIEVIDADVRLQDLRSTVYVLRTFFISLIVIVCLCFLKEAVFGMFGSFNVVMDDMVSKAIDTVFGFF